jgi:hypothetical protein
MDCSTKWPSCRLWQRRNGVRLSAFHFHGYDGLEPICRYGFAEPTAVDYFRAFLPLGDTTDATKLDWKQFVLGMVPPSRPVIPCRVGHRT